MAAILGQVGIRHAFTILALPAVVALAVFAGSAGADAQLLIATVGTNDGFDIGLAYPDGRQVSVLEPGTYTVRVRDRSRLHNFHLASNQDGSVDFRTELEFVGEQDFTVTFKDRTRYAYACEPHWQVMNGSFVVISASSPPPPPPKAAVRTLRASVGATGKATISSTTVKAGRFKIVVRDRSTRHNFRLAGRGVNRTTRSDFTGSVTWRVRLGRGVYRFGSDAKRLPGRLRVR